MTATSDTRRRAAHRRALALCTAAAAAGALIAATPALASPEPLVQRGTGLSAPTGAVQTPDGARWVADALRGVCRIQHDGSGVEEDLYCNDPHAGAPHVGPESPAGLAFDARENVFYAGDVQSNHGGVWRLHWNAETGRIDAGDRIVALGDDRVTSVALAPGSDHAPASLLYATKGSPAVMRVDNPAGDAARPVAAGFGTAPAPAGLAVLDGRVYLAEGGRVTRFALGAGAGRLAAEVPGTDGIAATALAADAEHGRLYAGTSYPGLADDVVVIDPASGAVETYERGFAGVTGLGVELDGDLLVADDPGVAAGNIDSLDQARLFSVGKRPLGLGRVSITSAPAGWSAASAVTFAYESSHPHARFECRLDGGEWMSCEGYGSGSVTFDDLEQGTHAFELRAVTAAGTGFAARRVFVLDRTAPMIRIAEPGERTSVVRGQGRIELAASEAWVAFSCAIDDADLAACEPGQKLPVLAPGEHTLRVVGEDAAGNRSAEAVVSFTVIAPPVALPAPAPAPEVGRPLEPGVPAVPAAPAEAGFVPRGEVAGIVRSSAPRLHSLRLRTARLAQGARVLRLDLAAGGGARHARVTVRSSAGIVVVRRSVAVRPRLAIAFTAAEQRRLAPGRYVVSVALSGIGGEASGRDKGNVRSRVLRITAR